VRKDHQDPSNRGVTAGHSTWHGICPAAGWGRGFWATQSTQRQAGSCLVLDKPLPFRGSSQKPDPWGQGWTKAVTGLQPNRIGVRPDASSGQEPEHHARKRAEALSTEPVGQAATTPPTSPPWFFCLCPLLPLCTHPCGYLIWSHSFKCHRYVVMPTFLSSSHTFH
jgi:hypothetical protein